jgi:hypothetical protein
MTPCSLAPKTLNPNSKRVPCLSLAGSKQWFSILKIPSPFLAPLVWVLGVLCCQAQESVHQTHVMSSKPTPCISQGLECANAATPWLLKDGTLLLVWTAGGTVMFAKSLDMGHTFSKTIELARHEQFLDTGADARAQIVADEEGHVLIAYSFFKDKQWNAQINLLSSSDGGARFSMPSSLINSDKSERFPSLGVDATGRIYLAWVDKRWVHLQRSRGVRQLGGSIALSSTLDWGQSFSPMTIIQEESCECCRIAIDASQGPFTAIAYRALFAKGMRDHAVQVIRSEPSTLTPLAKKAQRVSSDLWQTDVCPHQGPAVAVSGLKTIHTVWFTQGQVRQGLFYARSTDMGEHFSRPMTMGDADKNESRPHILAIDKEIWMVWKRFDGAHSSVMMRHSTDDGITWSAEQRLAQTAGYSDHPLLLKQGGQAYLSWLTRMEGFQLINLKSSS